MHSAHAISGCVSVFFSVSNSDLDMNGRGWNEIIVNNRLSETDFFVSKWKRKLLYSVWIRCVCFLSDAIMSDQALSIKSNKTHLAAYRVRAGQKKNYSITGGGEANDVWSSILREEIGRLSGPAGSSSLVGGKGTHLFWYRCCRIKCVVV